MKEKTISSEKKLTKLNAPLIPEKCNDKADVKLINSEPNPRARTRRTVKLPRLKLEDLVSQITEETRIKRSPLDLQLGMKSGRNGVLPKTLHTPPSI